MSPETKRPKLILLRHGQSESNAAGLLVGRSDPPLTELGVRQAEAAGRYLAAERQGSDDGTPPRSLLIVSSPLQRACATAEIVARECGENVEVDVDEQLIELDYGEFDGLTLGQIAAPDWAAWREDPSWRPPGGETLVELQERVATWCDSLRAGGAEGDVIAVSHVSPIKAAAIWALNGGPELSWRLSLGVATITRISTSAPSLQSFGEAGHLAGVR
ncbi:MAG: histidine phosphatase family protein [Acidimicrobiales bacterium]